MAGEHEGSDICEVEPTFGFRLFWNREGGISILQAAEGYRNLVCLTVSEAERLLEGLADACDCKLQKGRRGKP